MEQSHVTSSKRNALRNPDARSVLVLLGISLLLWAPRVRGPLDLRYDGGVYYILGTSLAEGKGYRLLNEPGDIQAIQYPPLLPALVAINQWMLGTSDVQVVGQWLRWNFAALFTIYAVGVYALARTYLGAAYAFLVALIVILNADTIFLSDLLFCELPFALATVLFVISNRKSEQRVFSIPTSLLAMMAYLLRATGMALLAAWVAESLLKRRWKQAAARVGLSLIPVIAWQAYIGRVKSGEEFKHPAYAYQRAPYQYYNVGYVENILLVDPFVPELGKLTPGAFVGRIAENLALMPANLGRVVIGGAKIQEWLADLERQRGLLSRLLGQAVGLTPMAAGFLVLGGLILFIVQRDWLIPAYLVASLVLICLTPWPGQFKRYVTPLLPFVALSLVRLLAAFSRVSLSRWPGKWRLAGPLFLALVIAVALGRETISAVRTYWLFHSPVYQGETRGGQGTGYRLFFYDFEWGNFDAALSWLKAHSKGGEVIATQAPHWAYIRTGLKAVLPPMEADPATAQRLLDAVPVDYLIVDSLGFLGVTSMYAEPVIRAYADRWSLLYNVPGSQTRIYRRLAQGEAVGRRTHFPIVRDRALVGVNRRRGIVEERPRVTRDELEDRGGIAIDAAVQSRVLPQPALFRRRLAHVMNPHEDDPPTARRQRPQVLGDAAAPQLTDPRSETDRIDPGIMPFHVPGDPGHSRGDRVDDHQAGPTGPLGEILADLPEGLARVPRPPEIELAHDEQPCHDEQQEQCDADRPAKAA